MAKTQGKAKRNTSLKSICAYICLLGILIFLVYLLYLNYLKINDLNRMIKNNKEEVAELNLLIEDKNEKLNQLINLDEDIENIKDEYFELALEIENKVRNKQLDSKICYLTFDDGPYLLTNDFLDVLSEYDVQASFFIRKRDDKDYDEIYLRYLKDGHTIGNHTANHNIFKGLYDSEENFLKDILENREFIEEKLGITTNVMRFPGGSSEIEYLGLNKASLVSKLVEQHYGYVDWNLTTGDGGTVLSVEESIANVLNYSQDLDVAVVLMHDYSRVTLKALPSIIEGLKKQGYIFLPLYYDSPSVKKK